MRVDPRLERRPGVVDVFELETVGVGEEHRVVAGPVLRIFCRRVEDGDAGGDQPVVQTVDILPGVGIPGEVMQADRVAVMCARVQAGRRAMPQTPSGKIRSQTTTSSVSLTQR